MSVLTTKARSALDTSSFAEPAKRAYPIEDPNHARNALARVSQFGSPAEKTQVRAAVARKWPGIGSSQAKVAAAPPSVARNGSPRMTGQGERQLDGSRTPTFSQPVKKGGLAERQPAPNRSSGGSGLEAAMHTLADQLHPRTSRSKG